MGNEFSEQKRAQEMLRIYNSWLKGFLDLISKHFAKEAGLPRK